MTPHPEQQAQPAWALSLSIVADDIDSDGRRARRPMLKPRGDRADTALMQDSVRDPHRLAVLHDLEILDTPPERSYDDIVALASISTGSPIAAVNFVDGNRHWTKAAVGVDRGHDASVAGDLSFCVAAVRSGEDLLCVTDTLASDEWRDHPLVAGPPHVRFYAGAAVVVSNHPVGVVCIYGDRPRALTRQDERALRALARQVGVQLELRQRDSRQLDPGLTDPLTGTASRRLLLDRLEIAIAQRESRRGEVGVVFCSVPRTEDERPELGDRRLIRVAERLREVTGHADTVARSALDEFAVVLPDLAEGELTTILARISAALRIREPSTNPPHAAGVSVAARLVEDGESASSVLRRAAQTILAA